MASRFNSTAFRHIAFLVTIALFLLGALVVSAQDMTAGGGGTLQSRGKHAARHA